jgi:Ca2+-binding EF-hand superfamily protein
MSSFNDNKHQFPIDLRTEDEKKVDEYHQSKDELLVLEEKLKIFVNNDPKICYKDIDTLGKKLGVKLSKQSIEHMIWEVDEDSDQLISWDEVQLTYCRNMENQTDIEPNSFFRLIEFLTFDEMNKGYIIEDDCMEMLFARYGSGKLENELTLIFGKKLRSQGGDGTLDLAGYLAAAQGRIGRRALVT